MLRAKFILSAYFILSSVYFYETVETRQCYVCQGCLDVTESDLVTCVPPENNPGGDVDPDADVDNPDGDVTSPEDNPVGDATSPEDNPNGDVTSPEEHPDGDVNPPEDNPDGDVNSPEDNPDGDENSPEDNPDADINPPEDNPDGDINPPEDNPDEDLDPPEDNPDGDVNPPEDNPNGDVNPPEDNPDGENAPDNDPDGNPQDPEEEGNASPERKNVNVVAPELLLTNLRKVDVSYRPSPHVVLRAQRQLRDDNEPEARCLATYYIDPQTNENNVVRSCIFVSPSEEVDKEAKCKEAIPGDFTGNLESCLVCDEDGCNSVGKTTGTIILLLTSLAFTKLF